MSNRFIALMLLLGAILGIGVSPAHAAPVPAYGLAGGWSASALSPLLAPPAPARWHKFAKSSRSPQELAAKFRRSLAQDPSGRMPIDGAACGRACATPEDFLDMWQKSDPAAKLTSVSQLPAYAERLVMKSPPSGDWWMACKTGAGSAGDAPKWDCLTRVFKPGEMCFANPDTGRCVLAQDCTNPVGREQKSGDCVYLLVANVPGDETHGTWLGPDPFPHGRCTLALKRAGDTEWVALLDECPRERCDFQAASRHFRMQIREPRFSWSAGREGYYILRLPKEVLQSRSGFILCVIRPHEGRQTHSKLMLARSYRTDGADLKVKAFVTYQGRSPVPATWPGLPHPWLFTDGRRD